MKYSRLLLLSAFALSSLPSLAAADEPTNAEWTKRRVQEDLVQPLQAKENNRSRFSRSRPPPSERRVRVTKDTVTSDAKGRNFLTYAVDIRYGFGSQGQWNENDVTGCVYRGTGEVYVKVGEAYRPVGFLLGKKVEPVAGVCTAAPSDKRS